MNRINADPTTVFGGGGFVSSRSLLTVRTQRSIFRAEHRRPRRRFVNGPEVTALDLFLYQAFGLWFEFDGHALVARYGRIDEPAPGVNAALQALRVFDAVIA